MRDSSWHGSHRPGGHLGIGETNIRLKCVWTLVDVGFPRLRFNILGRKRWPTRQLNTIPCLGGEWWKDFNLHFVSQLLGKLFQRSETEKHYFPFRIITNKRRFKTTSRIVGNCRPRGVSANLAWLWWCCLYRVTPSAVVSSLFCGRRYQMNMSTQIWMDSS